MRIYTQIRWTCSRSRSTLMTKIETEIALISTVLLTKHKHNTLFQIKFSYEKNTLTCDKQFYHSVHISMYLDLASLIA